MKRTLFAAAAVALLSAPLAAQDAQFKVPANYQKFQTQGVFTADTDPGHVLPVNTPFQIFCVWKDGSTNDITQVYPVNVTSILPTTTSSEWDDTQWWTGSSASTYLKYYRLAWVVENWFISGQPSPNTENNWQWALWAIGAGKTTLSDCQAFMGVYQCSQSFGIISNAMAQTGTNPLITNWYVISDANSSCGRYHTVDCQEFIYYDPGSPPTELVPEPATMSLLAMGLAGMAGANARRRRKQGQK